MPQKKTSRAPAVIICVFSLFAVMLGGVLWSIFGQNASSLASAAGISLSDIEYATVRTKTESGALVCKKIDSRVGLSQLYSLLSNTAVEKKVCFGNRSFSSDYGVMIKLKNKNGLFQLTDVGNNFTLRNRSLLSPFFVCYYNVADEKAFCGLLSSLASV